MLKHKNIQMTLWLKLHCQSSSNKELTFDKTLSTNHSNFILGIFLYGAGSHRVAFNIYSSDVMYLMLEILFVQIKVKLTKLIKS